MMWDCLLSLLPCGRKFSYEANRGLELNAEMAKQIFTPQPPGPSALLLRWREPEDGPTLVLNMKKNKIHRGFAYIRMVGYKAIKLKTNKL